MSDADRDGVIARLNSAAAEGRLTLSEFEERVDGVLKARTFGEVEPFVMDLPAAPAASTDVVVLRSHAGSIKRKGRWTVPRRLVVQAKAGSVKLDLRHAIIPSGAVQIELKTQAGSTVIVLPPGATANIDGVTASAGSARSAVPSTPRPDAHAPHVVVAGSTAAGSLKVRYERRFWRWRW